MELANYFLKSEGHKKLLQLLFFDELEFSVHELAALTKMPYASVHSEVRQLRETGTVTERAEKRSTYYKGNLKPEVKLALQQLFGFVSSGFSHDLKDAELKTSLVNAGGPLVDEVGEEGAPVAKASLEETLVRAALLARKDAGVARALPVAVAKNLRYLDQNLLMFWSRRLNAKQEVGFFLALSGELSKEMKLKRFAVKFKDDRVQNTRDFFVSQTSTELQRQLAERNTPALARKWNFRMNMSLESFRSTYSRFMTNDLSA